MRLKSKDNKALILTIIKQIVAKKYRVLLNDTTDFRHVLSDIMTYVEERYGRKPSNLSEEEHFTNLNKICLKEAIQYIKDNLQLFSPIKTTTDDPSMSQESTTQGAEQQLSQPLLQPQLQPQPQLQLQPSPDAIGNYNLNFYSTSTPTPTSTPTSSAVTSYVDNTKNLPQGILYTSNSQPTSTQYSRDNLPNPNANPTAAMNIPSFQMPSEPLNKKIADQALQMAIEQRQKESPFMKAPTYAGNNPSSLDQSGNISLMNLLLQTPLLSHCPDMIASVMNEIMGMPQLVDQMNNNPQEFQRSIMNPQFLEMIVRTIKGRNDPKLKPMSLVDTEVPSTSDPKTGNDLSRAIEAYKNQDPSLSTAGGSDPNVNKMNLYLPPSDLLVNNVLPDLDLIHFIEYDLALDFRTDLEPSDLKNQYPLKFIKFGNISKVRLSSCLIPENDLMIDEPYVYIKVTELGGRCYTANLDHVFGKLILASHVDGYLQYVPDRDSCLQIFSQPATFQRFTISFVNFNGKSLNLKEIAVLKALTMKKDNKIKLITLHKHKLSSGDTIEIHICHKHSIDAYDVPIEQVIDETTLVVDNVFEKLSTQISILRKSVNCSFKFTLYEINWNLLTKKTIQNAQLIRLSHLVTERRQEALEQTGNDKDIIKYVKTQMNPGQIQMNPGQIQMNPGQIQMNSGQTQMNPGQIQMNPGQTQGQFQGQVPTMTYTPGPLPPYINSK